MCMETLEYVMLEIGSIAPDFALEDQTRQIVRLSDFLGKKHVVLAFHPFAFTPVCTAQMQSYEQAQPGLTDLDAQVIGISTDAGPSKAAWAKSLGGLSFPVLTDFHPHGQVAASYGVLGPFGTAERAIFIVDKSGKIAWRQLKGMDDHPVLDELLAELRKLQK